MGLRKHQYEQSYWRWWNTSWAVSNPERNVPLVSLIFLKRSLVFLILFISISLHWSLRKAFLSLLGILWISAFRCYIFPFLLCFSLLFFSQLFVRPPQTAILPFLPFIFHGDGLDLCLLYNVTNLSPFIRYDLNQIPYDYTVEVRNRFKGLDLIDRVPSELWTEVHDIVQETGIKTIGDGCICIREYSIILIIICLIL